MSLFSTARAGPRSGCSVLQFTHDSAGGAATPLVVHERDNLGNDLRRARHRGNLDGHSCRHRSKPEVFDHLMASSLVAKRTSWPANCNDRARLRSRTTCPTADTALTSTRRSNFLMRARRLGMATGHPQLHPESRQPAMGDAPRRRWRLRTEAVHFFARIGAPWPNRPVRRSPGPVMRLW